MLSLWRPGTQKGILESSNRDKKTLAQDQAELELKEESGGSLNSGP